LRRGLGAALPRIRPQSGKYVWVVGFTFAGPWEPRPASPEIAYPRSGIFHEVRPCGAS
jgi:hypothetical protein